MCVLSVRLFNSACAACPVTLHLHSAPLVPCSEEEVLDWFQDLNAMKYCKQFVEKVLDIWMYPHPRMHAPPPPHTHAPPSHTPTPTPTHSSCNPLYAQGYNQLSDVARLDEEAIKKVVSVGSYVGVGRGCW